MEHRTATAEVEVYLQFMHALNWLINWFNAQFLGWAILRQGQGATNKLYLDMSTRKVVIYIFKIFVVLLAREGGEK